MNENQKKASIIIRKLLIYLIIPAFISLIFVCGYFSGNLRLQELVAPAINREYGLLENFQNLLLIAVIILAGYGITRKRLRFEKIILGCVLAGMIFLFLEEIDYGRHYYLYLTGNLHYVHRSGQNWNVHNMGNVNQLFKRTLDMGMIAFFIIFPLVTWKSTNRLILYLRPDRWFMLTIAVMFIISHIAHALDRIGLGMDGALQGNIAEFREVNVYYVFLLYLFELIFRRDYLPPERSNQP